MPLKNFQVLNPFVITTEKITLNIQRFEIWNLYMLDSRLYLRALLDEAGSETQLACKDKRMVTPIKSSILWINRLFVCLFMHINASIKLLWNVISWETNTTINMQIYSSRIVHAQKHIFFWQASPIYFYVLFTFYLQVCFLTIYQMKVMLSHSSVFVGQFSKCS